MKVRNFHFCLLIFFFLHVFSFPSSVFSFFLSSLAPRYIAGSLLMRKWSRTGYFILLMLFICSVYNEASLWSILQQNCVSQRLDFISELLWLPSPHRYHLCMQSPPLKHMTKLIFPLSFYINPSICSEKFSEGLLCCGVLLQNMQSSD